MADLSTTKIYGDLTVSNNIKGYRIANLDDISVIYEDRSITAGNGLSGGGALSNNLTISMGTPTGLTAGTTNALTATSHTHSIATATAVGLSNASVSGTGTSTSLARADHTHAITGFSLSTHNHTLDSLSNVTITSVDSGEIVKWNGTSWINNTLEEAGIQPLDADLSAIADLAGATGLLRKTAANTWTLDTTGYTTNTGTVTSVGISVPTGLSVSESPITTSGTIAISLTNGYSIPTTAVQTNWSAAYTDTSTATNSNTASKIVKRDASGNFSAGTITASLTGNATSANKVNKALSLKFDTDTAVEGTNLYTFDGSSAKTINIKGGTNVSITKASGEITISATDTTYTSASFTHSELTGTHNLTDDLAPVWGNITGKPDTVSGYGITDAMTTAHPANNFTSTEVSNLRAGKLDNGTTPWTDASNITSGTISIDRLPALAITNTYVKNNETDHLAMTTLTQEGDVVIRPDINRTYIRNSGTAGTMADWTMLETPDGEVLSVNGKTGTVSLVPTDIGASPSGHTHPTTVTHNATNLTLATGGTSATVNGATATTAGVVTNGAQTWAGVKTFNSAPISANGYTTGSATMVYNNTSKTIDFVFV